MPDEKKDSVGEIAIKMIYLFYWKKFKEIEFPIVPPVTGQKYFAAAAIIVLLGVIELNKNETNRTSTIR